MNQLNCNEFAPQRVPEITRRHPLGLPPSIVACEVYQKHSQLHGCVKSFPPRLIWRAVGRQPSVSHGFVHGRLTPNRSSHELPSVEIASNPVNRGFSVTWNVVILPIFDFEQLALELINHSI